MNQHILKTTPEFFQAVKSGEKMFEARINDRNYQVGDMLILREWLPHMQQYSGEEEIRTVTYILDHEQYCAPGYVIMSLGDNMHQGG
jgi:ASC-1-like (ASCH) protein